MPSRLPKILLPLLLIAVAACADEPAKPAAAPAVTPNVITPPAPNAGLSPANASAIGLVTAEEAEPAGARKLNQVRKHLADVLTKYDANHDGVIDATELAAAREALATEREERGKTGTRPRAKPSPPAPLTP